MELEPYDVVVVGGGITGPADIYVGTEYTNIRRWALVEKEGGLAQVASGHEANSQTLHFGEIESNYDLPHALLVQQAAERVAAYLAQRPDREIGFRTHTMVLGIGADEVAQLEARFAEFAPHYPSLRLLRRDDIAVIEPNVVAGRDPNEPIVALMSTDGHVVNYGRLAESFLHDARASGVVCDTFFHTSVQRIERVVGGFIVHTDGGDLRARAVAVTAGGHSLLFAKQMGYGTELEILPIAGSFFRTKIRQCLRGKVYTVQQPGRPFAATHGDPEVTNPDETRFGPTAKPIPYLERHRPGTILDFLRTVVWNARGLLAYFAILADRRMLAFALRNICMDLPFIGVRLFLRDVRKIVPTMRARDLVRARGVGGVRPQLVDTRTRAMLFGDGRLIGDRITFRITPSPGATACLRSAEEDVEMLCDFLGAQFDRERYARDHTRTSNRDHAIAS